MAAVVQDNPDLTRYEVFENGELAGFSEYTRSDGAIAVKHTEVDDRFEGRGIGSALARGVLDAARSDGLAVLPYCPFMAALHPRSQGRLPRAGPQDQRAKFDL